MRGKVNTDHRPFKKGKSDLSIHSTDLLEKLSDSQDVTGGGSAAALVGSMAASLALKVLNNEKRRESQKENLPEINEKVIELEEMSQQLEKLIQEDPKALQPLIDAYKLPKESDQEKEYRKNAIQDGIEEAAGPQVEILETINNLSESHLFIIELKPQGSIVTNLAESILFSKSALQVAHIGARTNYESLADADKRQERVEYVDKLLSKGKRQLNRLYERVVEVI